MSNLFSTYIQYQEVENEVKEVDRRISSIENCYDNDTVETIYMDPLTANEVSKRIVYAVDYHEHDVLCYGYDRVWFKKIDGKWVVNRVETHDDICWSEKV